MDYLKALLDGMGEYQSKDFNHNMPDVIFVRNDIYMNLMRQCGRSFYEIRMIQKLIRLPSEPCFNHNRPFHFYSSDDLKEAARYNCEYDYIRILKTKPALMRDWNSSCATPITSELEMETIDISTELVAFWKDQQ